MTGTGDGIRLDFGETVKPGSTKTGPGWKLHNMTWYNTHIADSMYIWYVSNYCYIESNQHIRIYIYESQFLKAEKSNQLHCWVNFGRLGLHGVAAVGSTRAGSGRGEGVQPPHVDGTVDLHRKGVAVSHKTSGFEGYHYDVFRVSIVRIQIFAILPLGRNFWKVLKDQVWYSMMISALCQMIPSTSITLNPNLDLQVKVSLARALIMNPDLFLGFLGGSSCGAHLGISANGYRGWCCIVPSTTSTLEPPIRLSMFPGDNFEKTFFRSFTKSWHMSVGVAACLRLFIWEIGTACADVK